ncbi:Rpn family recombination-promoting nuclease/putative transposase, partial [Selenomonas sp.]|uniref:Rpn family recombination-promoting nuclease/putative transposase n=1 Tax=Selenomonas sp. TaxID=2053611 RepID=UPI003FA27B7C
MYCIKPWEDLTIQDDYMFKLIMNIKPICLKLLQGILRMEIKDIHYLETEKSMDARYQGKGIRMDVYVRDDAATVYNIEMQVRMLEGTSLFKRTRYYQSMIDADLLAAGADYDDLNKTIIIFICPFDPFGEGRHIYTFENICLENTKCKLQDGTTKIFLNTKGTMADVDESVKAFLDYVNGIVGEDPLVREIDEMIRRIKRENEERVSYMTFAMKMMEERKEGFREGERQGFTNGLAEGKA